MWRALAISVLMFAACGDDGVHHLADAPPATILVEPPDVTITIVNGQAVAQPYTASIMQMDGTLLDVTAETTFQLANPAYGTFAGATATVTGQGAGPTRVLAVDGDVTGDTGLTVLVKSAVIDPGAPANAEGLFGGAVEDPARAPAIVYPLDHILVPPNLGQFDVHWSNGQKTNDLFQIAIANDYVDIKLYTTGLDPQNPQPFWSVFQPLIWYPVASSKQQLTLTVSGMDTTMSGAKGTSVAQKVDVTNENAQGGIYYWTTSGAAGIWRYDVSQPTVPPAAYFDDNARPSGCMGCHSLSRDGTKIAMTLDGGGGRGAVFDVATRQPTYDFATAPLYWDFAAFDAHATKLVTVEGGVLNLRGLDGTLIAGPIANLAGPWATMPELSPDDSHMVNVEYSAGNDLQAYYGEIVQRTFDPATNTFGAPTMLVPQTTGVANYYPSYSPDGQWIVFTRTQAYSYNDGTAETWVVKADGTQEPMQLNVADLTGNLTNSWARWVPFAQTFGAQNEPLFYLTFSSQRPFGVRIPSGGRPQIWMTPFFPAKAAAGQDPSGAAFRVPFQDVNTANHIAQWTQAVVVQ